MSDAKPLLKASTSPGWDDGLTGKERLFLQEYFVDLNGTRAAQRAGYSPDNSNAAAITACKLHKKPHIKAAIDKLFESRGISKLRILEEMAKVAYANIGDFVRVVDGKVCVTDFDKLTPEQIASICTVTETISEFGTSITVKPYDKLTALLYLGKASRLFVERAEISGPNGGPIPIEDTTEQIRKRIAERLDKMAALFAPQPEKTIEGTTGEIAKPV